MPASALLIDHRLLEKNFCESEKIFFTRMHNSRIIIGALGRVPKAEDTEVFIQSIEPSVGEWTPKALLRSAQVLSADPLVSWLVWKDSSIVRAAETAGFAGVVVVGASVEGISADIPVNEATGLADVPRVLIPKNGGCWHHQIK